MKRILLLLLFVVNLQITITDSAIGLRCGAVTHAQTMAREVNGGCEYSDGNGWSLWTPMPCDPVIANGYPCSYCHKGHDTDIQREIHIETECPEYTTSCPKCHTTLLRKELANHQCSGTDYPNNSNESNWGGETSGGGGYSSGGEYSSSGGQSGGTSSNGSASGDFSWLNGKFTIPANIKACKVLLPKLVPHQKNPMDCFFASLANANLLLDPKMNKTAWNKKVDDLKKKYLKDYPKKGVDFNHIGTDPYWILSHQGDYNLTQIREKDWGNIPSLIDQGYMLVGSLPGHIVLIVGYRKDNHGIYYCMNTDLPKKGSYGSYVEIKQVQFEDIFKFNIK